MADCYQVLSTERWVTYVCTIILSPGIDMVARSSLSYYPRSARVKAMMYIICLTGCYFVI